MLSVMLFILHSSFLIFLVAVPYLTEPLYKYRSLEIDYNLYYFYCLKFSFRGNE